MSEIELLQGSKRDRLFEALFQLIDEKFEGGGTWAYDFVRKGSHDCIDRLNEKLQKAFESGQFKELLHFEFPDEEYLRMKAHHLSKKYCNLDDCVRGEKEYRETVFEQQRQDWLRILEGALEKHEKQGIIAN